MSRKKDLLKQLKKSINGDGNFNNIKNRIINVEQERKIKKSNKKKYRREVVI